MSYILLLYRPSLDNTGKSHHHAVKYVFEIAGIDFEKLKLVMLSYLTAVCSESFHVDIMSVTFNFGSDKQIR